MDEAKTEDVFDGYGFAIRTFYFDVNELHIHRGWSQNSLNTGRTKFYSSIKGRAVSEDRVGIIGRDGSVKDFEFTLGVDTDAKESWEWLKAHDVLAYTDNSKYNPEHIRIKNLIGERLDANPPTATLLNWDDDWETGTKAGWSIVCQIPPDVFSKIEDEIVAKAVNSISMSVRWEAGLVFDEHAPPSVPTVWGLFCLEENRSPEPLRGHVISIQWSPTNHGETKPKEASDDMPAPTPAPVTAVAPVVFNVPKSAIAALWVLALATALHLSN
jgi:hypothetical protein